MMSTEYIERKSKLTKLTSVISALAPSGEGKETLMGSACTRVKAAL